MQVRLYLPFRGWHLVVTRAGEFLLCLARGCPFWVSSEFATIHIRALYFAVWAKLVYKLTAQINGHDCNPQKVVVKKPADFHGKIV